MKNLSIKLLIPRKYNIENFWNQMWVVLRNISMLAAVIWLWQNSLCVTTTYWVGRQKKRRMMGKQSVGWSEETVTATNVYEYCITFFHWFGSSNSAGRVMRLSKHMFGCESKRQYSDMRCVSEAWKTLDVHNGEFLLIMPVEISKMLQSGTTSMV